MDAAKLAKLQQSVRIGRSINFFISVGISLGEFARSVEGELMDGRHMTNHELIVYRGQM
jgi:hypothetical protein